MLWVSISVKAVNPRVRAINPGKKYRKLCNTVRLGLCLNKGLRDTLTIFGGSLFAYCEYSKLVDLASHLVFVDVFDFAAIVYIDRLLHGFVSFSTLYSYAMNF